MFKRVFDLQDSYNPRASTITFATVTLLSGFLSTLLPETLNTIMPQTMQDGEDFGKGDTCFSTGCFGRSRKENLEKEKEPVTEINETT